jgi:superfamily II DNA or RNA helicase
MKNTFLTNYTEQTFLNQIKDNLRSCSLFCFSVSFIKKAGLSLLYRDIEAALNRGAVGKIITSTYQNFTDIDSLRLFLMMTETHKNFECHLDFESFHDEGYRAIGYHSKGYYFEFDDEAELVIGSSNITRYALLKNVEWDLVVRDNRSNPVFCEMLSEFNDKWNNTYALNKDLIAQYVGKLNYAIERWDMDYDLSSGEVVPNFMQRKALKELNRYRVMGIKRALIVAAAGSGKTYLAAFDSRNFNPKRLLYIVHEASIMQKAMESFREVFGNSVTYGIYNKDNKNTDADFIFAGNIILSQNLKQFHPDEFDYIIMDECHHATADSYKKIHEYFRPEFLLGLTATPERMDNEDVFGLFDANVPYELRLRDAIINELVVPFRYYGIRDKLVDYGLSKAEERKLVSLLATPEHCGFVKSKIEEHRPNGKLKALAFCRNITHAMMMADGLAELGYYTAYLTGKNTVGERIKAYNDLQNEEGSLEILCTVDILNEGVDIPGCNMVLFLRPTESSTIFIQQLGRGLRKYKDKQYVTVLDFIGNSYKRSVQIAFALGSLSENFVMEKRLMKSLVKDNFSALELSKYGVVIDFDEESQKEIIDYIDRENFNSKQYMEQDYYNFKKYIGAEFPPKHMDYLNNDCAPDLMRFLQIKIDGRKTECYYSFLQGIGEENLPVFNDDQVAFIKYLSSLLPLVRAHEYLIVNALMNGEMSEADVKSYIQSHISTYKDEEFEHALVFMHKAGAIKRENGKVTLNVKLDAELIDYINDLVKYGLSRYEADYANSDKFLLWHDYRIDQVQRKLLKNPGHIFKGTYFYGEEAIVFASLKKDASVEERLHYNDKFLDPKVFQWECENNISDKDLAALRLCKYVHLFVRKVSNENGIQQPYIYVGEGRFSNERKQVKDNAGNKKDVTYLYDIPMNETLPDYLQYDFGVAK